jgi:serine/threonine protein kinase HipA of HipAB toxin-antitoxin module
MSERMAELLVILARHDVAPDIQELLLRTGALAAVERACMNAAYERAAQHAEGHYVEDGLWSLNCERWDRDSAYGKGRLDAAAAIRELGESDE